MTRLSIHDTPNETLLTLVTAALSQGKIVIFPTETCYGIGVDARNPQAVDQLLAFKGNRNNKAISIAVADIIMAQDYVDINDLARNLYSTLLPGPVTVISKDKGKVAKQLVSDQGSLGVRIPNYPLTLEIVKAFGSPITATSANTSGQKPPYSFEQWQRYTTTAKQDLVTYFIDAGPLPYRPPSTVVDTTLNEPTVLRQGEIIIPSKGSVSVKSSSVAETQAVAQQILKEYGAQATVERKTLVLALQGELGAGKTHFVQGLAKGLQITDNVPSPTYTLMREYSFATGMLYHIDTWRMHEATDLEQLGFSTLLKPQNIVAIEWVQKVTEIIKAVQPLALIVWIDIAVISEHERVIRYSTKIIQA